MRVSLSSLLCVVVVALSLANANHGIDIEGSSTTSISFSTLAATTDTYKTFIHQLRQKLSVGADRVHDVPVLNQSVPDSKRFISIDLTNSFNAAITLAIDVVDVKVVAYLTSGKSYFFPDAPNSASQSLFSNSEKQVLNFSSSFQSIEIAAGTTRMTTSLGLTPLNSAIDNLFHYRREIVPSSFLVIIQMISEASKFKFIEQSVRNSIRNGKEFTPSLAIVSLEDNWANLSAYIQASLDMQGLFPHPIQLYNSKDELLMLDSIYYPIIFTNIALQLYRFHSGNDLIPKLIRMPESNDYDDDPPEVKERTTWISGRNRLCVSLEPYSIPYDGSPIALYNCALYKREQWTFERDGTIRSYGRCMTISGTRLEINKCGVGGQEARTWKVHSDGTISNPSSGLYLDAIYYLTVEEKSNASSQVWRLGNNFEPIITSIIGFKGMCLEAIASSNYEKLWMEECVIGKKDQEWALHSDGTIRVNDEWNFLCVSTNTGGIGDVLTIRWWDGSENQRWVFKADGSIVNPASGYVIDVSNNDVNLHKIILYPFQNHDNQKWLPFY